jgi:hypothetical protein
MANKKKPTKEDIKTEDVEDAEIVETETEDKTPEEPVKLEVEETEPEVQRLSKALNFLNDLYEQTQQNCPDANRSKILNQVLIETEVFLVNSGMRHWNKEVT